MGGFGKCVLKLKFFECTITKYCLPFAGVRPRSSPQRVPLGTGRCCNAGEREMFIVLRRGGKFALTPNALSVIPLHSRLQQRVGLCKPFLKSLQENTADSPNFTSEN